MAVFEEGYFDPFDFQGMTPAERLALFRNMQITVDDNGAQYLMSHQTEETAKHIVALTFSKDRQYATYLTDQGDIVQAVYNPDGKLDRVRAASKSPIGVYAAMAEFLKAGESIDPAQVDFSRASKRSAETWAEAYKHYLAYQKLPTPELGISNLRQMPRRDAGPGAYQNTSAA